MPSWAGGARTDYVEKKARGRFLAFDIETAKVAVEGIDLLAQRPLGISCAATLTSDGDLQVWQGAGEKMTVRQCRKLVEYLEMMSRKGYMITGWNSLGFDWDVLAEESGMWETCKKLAREHIDGMFHFFCQEGVAVGLQAAKGMGLEGKSGSGKDAPAMWAAGQREEILAYVAQDVKVTLNVILEIQKRGRMDWIAKSGRLMIYDLPKRKLFTVKEAMKLPLPNTSWMSRPPWLRSKFIDWLEKDNQ